MDEYEQDGGFGYYCPNCLDECCEAELIYNDTEEEDIGTEYTCPHCGWTGIWIYPTDCRHFPKYET